jgi:hypothetical protein
MLVYLGVAFVVIAGLTLTYPVLFRRADQSRKEHELALGLKLDRLDEMARHAVEICKLAETELDVDDPSCLERLRSRADDARQATCDRLIEHDMLVPEHTAMLKLGSRSERRRRQIALTASAAKLETSFARECEALDLAIDRIRLGREKASQRIEDRQQHPLHCASCGGHVGEARFCPGCGEEAPEMTRCRSCGHELRIPSHLLAKGVHTLHLHCMACGEYPRTTSLSGAGAEGD